MYLIRSSLSCPIGFGLVGVGLILLMGCSGRVAYSPIADHLHQGNYGVAPTVVGDSLRVASYNIAFAQEIEQGLQDLQNNPHLVDADIILLQEMDRQGTDQMAKTLRMNYVYWPAFVHQYHGRTFGNAVLSRWPIVGQEAVVLPHPNPVDGHHRLAVAADVQVGSNRVRAVSVHLSTIVVSLENRMEQATTLIDSLAAPDYPTVFGGDFNTAGKAGVQALRRLMRKAGYRQVRLPTGATASGGILNLTGHKLILDHFFYTGLTGGSSGIDRTTLASDHYPIWSVFAWR